MYRFNTIILLASALASSAASAQSARELTPSEKACRFWSVNLPGQEVVYIHGPTMQALGKYVFNEDTLDARVAMSGNVRRWASAESCMATHLSGIGGNACQVTCVATGVESELAGEPIRKYIEADLSKAVSAQVRSMMTEFLGELRKANDEGRQALVESLSQELPNHPDLIQALREAIRKAPAKPAAAKTK